MSSPARALALLNLFTEDRPTWHTDEMNEELGYTRATGYRYVKELVEAGFLKKVSAGRYSLGARIIELDYQLRRSDPVLLAAIPVMDELARRQKVDVVLTAMFGQQLVDTHRSSGTPGLELQYSRGRPRPLFRGAAPKVLMAHLPRAQQVKLYETRAQEIEAAGLGTSWAEFRTYLAAVRKAGYYYSLGELEPERGALAVPLFDGDDEVVAALALVGSPQQLEGLGEGKLLRLLSRAAAEVRAHWVGG